MLAISLRTLRVKLAYIGSMATGMPAETFMASAFCLCSVQEAGLQSGQVWSHGSTLRQTSDGGFMRRAVLLWFCVLAACGTANKSNATTGAANGGTTGSITDAVADTGGNTSSGSNTGSTTASGTATGSSTATTGSHGGDATPTFTMAVTNSSIVARRGVVASLDVTIARDVGFSSTVLVSVYAPPPWLSCNEQELNEAEIQTLLDCGVSSVAPIGVHDVSIRAASGGTTRDTTIHFQVLGRHGELDDTFGSAGVASALVGVGNRQLYSAVVDAERQLIMIFGAVESSVGSGSRLGAALFNADGQLIESFGSSGKLTVAAQRPAAMVRFDASGGFTFLVGNGQPHLYRTLSDGSADSDFGTGGSSPDITSVAVNTAVVDLGIGVGYALAGSHAGSIAIALLDDVGSLSSVSTDGIFDDVFSGASATGIFVPGWFLLPELGGTDAKSAGLAKYVDAGSLDAGFDDDGFVIGPSFPSASQVLTGGVSVDVLGRPVIVGQLPYGAGTPYEWLVVRYAADGALDTTFSSDGIAITDIAGGNEGARAVSHPYGDGSFLVCGHATDGVGAELVPLVKYLDDGSLDSAFGIAGKVKLTMPSGVCQSLVPFDENRVLVVGNSSAGFFVARVWL